MADYLKSPRPLNTCASLISRLAKIVFVDCVLTDQEIRRRKRVSHTPVVSQASDLIKEMLLPVLVECLITINVII